MLKFLRKNKQVLLVKRGSITQEDIEKLEGEGFVIVQSDTPGDITPLQETVEKSEGDGKAVFLDAGFEKEAKELAREDDGSAAWYKRIFNLK